MPRSSPLAWWRDVPSAICMPRPSSGAEVAQVLMAGGAARAPAAGRDEPEHDVVAGRQPADAGADLLHDAGALVAADDRQRERQVAGDEVLVGVAHARRRQLDQHLTGPGRVELDLLDAPRRIRLPTGQQPWSSSMNPPNEHEPMDGAAPYQHRRTRDVQPSGGGSGRSLTRYSSWTARVMAT